MEAPESVLYWDHLSRTPDTSHSCSSVPRPSTSLHWELRGVACLLFGELLSGPCLLIWALSGEAGVPARAYSDNGGVLGQVPLCRWDAVKVKAR